MAEQSRHNVLQRINHQCTVSCTQEGEDHCADHFIGIIPYNKAAEWFAKNSQHIAALRSTNDGKLYLKLALGNEEKTGEALRDELINLADKHTH